MSKRIKLELKDLTWVTSFSLGSALIAKLLYDNGIINLYMSLALAMIILLMICYHGVKRIKMKRSLGSYKKYRGSVKEGIVMLFGLLLLYGINILYKNTSINGYIALVLLAADLFMISFYLRYKEGKWLDSIERNEVPQ